MSTVQGYSVESSPAQAPAPIPDVPTSPSQAKIMSKKPSPSRAPAVSRRSPSASRRNGSVSRSPPTNRRALPPTNGHRSHKPSPARGPSTAALPRTSSFTAPRTSRPPSVARRPAVSRAGTSTRPVPTTVSRPASVASNFSVAESLRAAAFKRMPSERRGGSVKSSKTRTSTSSRSGGRRAYYAGPSPLDAIVEKISSQGPVRSPGTQYTITVPRVLPVVPLLGWPLWLLKVYL